MKELGRCYNLFRRIQRTDSLIVRSTEVRAHSRAEQALAPVLQGGRIYMSADKNYSAKLPVIYHLQSCRITLVDAKSNNVEESVLQKEYSFPKMHVFLSVHARKAEVGFTNKTGSTQASFLLHIQRYTKYTGASVCIQ